MFYSNNYVAFLGGINCNELNILELEFLSTLTWNLTVDEGEYDRYSSSLN